MNACEQESAGQMADQFVPLVGAILFGVMASTSQLSADVVRIDLPPETASFKPAPGSEFANGQCLTCHSVEYVVTQPPLPRTFWGAEVKKMQEKFGAQIPGDQVELLVSYLTSNYGAETNHQSMAQPGATTTVSPAPASTASAESIAMRYGCLACHNVSAKVVGPAYKDVAAKYREDPLALDKISQQIHNGGSGKWGPVIMPPFPMVSDAEARILAQWILGQVAR
jgi:cytochrome c551/c552